MTVVRPERQRSTTAAPASPAAPPIMAGADGDTRAVKRAQMRSEFGTCPINKPRPDVHRDLERGWLLPTLLTLDHLFWGRWDYWMQMTATCTLPAEPIPRLDFLDVANSHTRKMLETTLDAISNQGRGSWMGWSSYDYFRYFLDWLLWGFGHPTLTHAPPEPSGCAGASDRLYQIFNVGLLLLWPYDYFGDMLAENKHGRHNGFYPTPHTLVELMVQMTCGVGENDLRQKTVCDPALGTGRMLLHASNYSLHLAGMDIDGTMCKTTLVNAYLFAPWLAKPLHNLLPIETPPPVCVLPALAEQRGEEVDTGDVEQTWRFQAVHQSKKKNNQKSNNNSGPEIKQGLLF